MYNPFNIPSTLIMCHTIQESITNWKLENPCQLKKSNINTCYERRIESVDKALKDFNSINYKST